MQIDRCFGFDTAVEESQRALLAAKVEATSAYKGIGLVKLMGRQSGFIAMQASMASGAPHILLVLTLKTLIITPKRCPRHQRFLLWPHVEVPPRPPTCDPPSKPATTACHSLCQIQEERLSCCNEHGTRN